MKIKLLLLFVTLLFVVGTANAAFQVKVQALSNFSTKTPANQISVNIQETVQLGENILNTGDILNCKVLEVTSPKRGKQNANIYVQPVSYTSNGNTINVNEIFIGKYSKTILSKEELLKMKKTPIIKKAAVTVGNFYIKGLKQGVSLAEGMIENKENNRLESGLKQVYEDSAFSYIEKGNDISIVSGDEFYFVFKKEEQEEEDKPNYSYTENAG